MESAPPEEVRTAQTHGSPRGIGIKSFSARQRMWAETGIAVTALA
jgi:hypothetical protein